MAEINKTAENKELFVQLGIASRDAGDYAKAIEWFGKAVEQGDTRAQFELGFMYLNGQGVSQDYTKAAEWFRKAAEQDDANAQSKLGLLYLTGQGVVEDKAKAAEWFSKAATQGDTRAQFYTGLLLQDDAEAAKWYGKAVEQGDVDAQYELGLLYLNGQGVPKDKAKAAELLLKAAEQGNVKARESFIKVLLETLISDANMQTLARASNWLQKEAFDQGHNKPKELLAIVNRAVKIEAERVAEEKRKAETVEKLLKAAEQGDAGAQYELGLLYLNGQGVPKDNAKAAEWLGKAAEQGDTDAQFKLGLLYSDGQGIPKDNAKAAEWFSKAAAQGNEQAKYFLVKSWEQQGLCKYCGGEIKAGLFSTKCKSCGKKPPDGFA